MITILRWILLPISIIYYLIIWFRNKLYDKKLLKSRSFSIPTIVVGNLAIGGAGKSPLTEYLIDLLKDKYKIATLSRGYGRKTKGFRIVNLNNKAIEVGDEPLQFKNKFPKITVSVDESRCNGIELLQENHDLILLDDAYQHRKLKPGFSILLFDYYSINRPIICLPTGNFRDIFSSSKRADLILITKCPSELSINQKQLIRKKISKYSQADVLFTQIKYRMAKSIFDHNKLIEVKNTKVLLFCGIANPEPLISYLKNQNNLVETIQFADHHNYTNSDYNKIIKHYNHLLQKNGGIILTTEKDYQRIDITVFNNYPTYYIPIEIDFLNNGKSIFNSTIETYLKKLDK